MHFLCVATYWFFFWLIVFVGGFSTWTTSSDERTIADESQWHFKKSLKVGKQFQPRKLTTENARLLEYTTISVMEVQYCHSHREVSSLSGAVAALSLLSVSCPCSVRQPWQIFKGWLLNRDQFKHLLNSSPVWELSV